MFGLIGSQPPFVKGEHLKSLLTPKKKPSNKPYSLSACKKYSEHVGVNLQMCGRSGEIHHL